MLYHYTSAFRVSYLYDFLSLTNTFYIYYGCMYGMWIVVMGCGIFYVVDLWNWL